jgi:signal transduction histidine kinase
MCNNLFMLRYAFRTALRHPSSLVFLFVLIASLAMALARAEPSLSGSEIIGILLFSLVYLLVGTWLFMAVLVDNRPGTKIVYLAFQIGLGFVILYLGRGNGWLVMLPLASQSVALFSPREALLPCLLITFGIAWNTSRMMTNWIPLFQSALVFGSAVFFAAMFTEISIRDARRREEIERLAARLEQANRDLQAYAEKVEELSAAQERNRLAREIHDGLGHYLTAMNVQAQVVAALVQQAPASAPQALAKLQSMILEALADVRRSVAALRSDAHLFENLLAALEPLVEESRNAGVETELVVNGQVRRLAAASELTLYRAVQEGLTNVRKHAQARRVTLLLEYRTQDVALRIQDDGVGSRLTVEQIKTLQGSFGLFGLGERVQLLNGNMTVQTAPGQGFCLEILLPTGETA